MNGSQYIWILNGVLMQNVALSRTADQSSSHPDGPARNAVDGNRDPNFAKGSCSLTHQESNPWWRVDLQNVCAIISHIPKGRTFYFPCSSTEGRYVTVFLPGTEKILTLCEVEVFPLDYADGNRVPNLALGGNAFQSSTHADGHASKAIDGRRDSKYGDGFCTHTSMETNPWWRLDLRETHTVTSVKVTNRGDCCAQRLDGAEIRIGNSAENNGNDNPKCASISHIGEGKTVTFYCEGGSVMGRFVNVIIPGPKKALTLCEVEVYAVDPLANVAPNGQATQSSLYANNARLLS
ncbi:fucolectin-like [Labrus bergylta]|uniref:fucolectin-like n=1 Tax=Labrus bergylta TaxID=56723 RepID=UPI0033132477